MTGGSEAPGLLVAWLVTLGVSFHLVIADERRLSGESLARAWPPVSRDAAIFAFQVLAVPIHFVKTRGRPGFRGLPHYAIGALLGIVALCIVVLETSLLTEAMTTLLGFDPPT